MEMDDIIKKVTVIAQSGEKKDILIVTLALEGVFTFCLCIISVVSSGTANAGFNIVLTTLLNICYIGGAAYILTNSKSQLALGFLIGVSATMSALNFMTAIFWGQLSHCTTGIIATGYTCTNRTSYGAISAFSVLVFLLQLFICLAIILWRNELLKEEAMNVGDDFRSDLITKPTSTDL